MPGDYTRLTFEPLKDRAMLLEQQGRVHLDADFNELAEIFERRFHLETRDVVGAAVYPAILPDSFKLIGAPAGPWTIGRGRMYVDGLLAENHGVGALEYEPVWDEPQGSEDTPVGQQPYVGTPQSPPIGSEPDELVYLDVWQREQTCVEDPSLLEPALGVDTATRVQTAWQVRKLDIDADLDCGSDWDGYGPWQDLVRRSDARLSSAATQPPDPADPCAVAPTGGYRGLENRLYRVEIHDGGGPGAATLKWSRDNGAVASRITGLNGAATQPIVTVERLGRDDVLRFHAGEWVELLDDVLELDRQPGLMGQVLETDETQSTVTLTAPLAGALDLTRNPRLRRWDQQAGVGAGGVITITASPQTIDLEDGIQVTITIDGAGARALVGDWWVFAARAASASIEALDQVPPRGVRHHFARLAVIHGGNVQDCRIPWPGECDCDGKGGDCGCTRCVTPESHHDDGGPLTIQAAIDAVLPTGGRVCVAPGLYRLKQPLRIVGAHGLTLSGDGLATVIEAPPELGILVEDSIEVSLERFALTPLGKLEQPLGIGIGLLNTVDCRVERCFISAGALPGTIGIALASLALRTRLLENVILAGTAIGDVGVGEKVAAEIPATFAPLGIDADGALPQPLASPKPYLTTVDLAIENNVLLGVRFGVRFGDTALGGFAGVNAVLTLHSDGMRIARNLVFGGASAGVSLQGTTLGGAAGAAGVGGLGQLATAGLALPARVDVRENLVVVAGDGVRSTLEELIVAENTLRGAGADKAGAQIGVLLGRSKGAKTTGSVRIAGNTITEQSGAGVLALGGVGSLEVTGNRVQRTGRGGVGILGRFEVSDVRVADNLLEDIGVATDPADDSLLWGIGIVASADAVVSANVLRRLAPARGPLVRTGVLVELVGAGHVDGNQLLDLGPVGGAYAGEVAGIRVISPVAVGVLGNTVRIPAVGERAVSTALSMAAAGVKHASAQGVLWSNVAGEPVSPGLPEVAVHGNTLHAGGQEPVAELLGPCNATFNDNRCRWLPELRTDAVVRIEVAGATIVSANHVEGPPVDALPAIQLDVGVGGSSTPHATVLGNIASGSIELNGAALPAPWSDFNINA